MNQRYGETLLLEIKEYYRKDFMKTIYKSRRDTQLKTLNIFDAYIELEKGICPYDLAVKYGYTAENFFYEKIKIARARINVYIKLKELGDV